jgi:hypothetical protein
MKRHFARCRPKRRSAETSFGQNVV